MRRNNLPPSNSYFRVIAPFKVWHVCGWKPAQVFYGRAQACDPIQEQVTAEVGDEIHNLHGGVFHVVEGTPWEAHRLPVPSALSMEHDRRVEEWPLTLMEPIPEKERSYADYRLAHKRITQEAAR